MRGKAMMTNVGVIDGVLRLVLGIGLLAWSRGRIGPVLPEIFAWIAWAAGLFSAATGIFRYCPAFALLGTNSCAIYPRADRTPPKGTGSGEGDLPE